MTKPVLYLFAISHYCEKAAWALDYFGIPYQPRHLIPGMNRGIAKKLGAKSGSLPFLDTGNGAVAGSAGIIDWAEQNRNPNRPSLTNDNANEIAQIEKRLDDILGVHIRRYYYSDALLTDPASVRPIFARDLPILQKIALRFAWPKITSAMIQLMDLGPEKGLQSRDIVEKELDWLDAMLADGRPYLTGNQFTRADLTAASLLAPLVNPPKHPSYANLSLPIGVAETIKEWEQRPVLQWVLRMYELHR
jgi:glutathione S-transferase